jgi:ABC-type multidrug transport system ATPase subunit
MEMGPMLEAIDITKKYGNMVALDKFNLELSKGRIMGLLGPNGSGKTTFLKTVAGVLKPNIVLDYEKGKHAIKANCKCLPLIVLSALFNLMLNFLYNKYSSRR